MSQPGDSKLMGATELSEYLGTSRNTAYTLLHRSDFPSVKIGALLFALRAEVDVWLESRAKEGGYDYGKKESER